MLQQSPQRFYAQPPEWFAEVELVHLAWLLCEAAHLLVAIVAIGHQGSATLDQVHLARIRSVDTFTFEFFHRHASALGLATKTEYPRLWQKSCTQPVMELVSITI